MGQEVECRLHYRCRTFAGRAQLETEHLLFRGEERLKVLFKDLTAVSASGGLLKLEFPGGPAELELGAAAEKWAAKILHPPSRLDKLGVKPGLTVLLIGEFDESFTVELRERQSQAPTAPAKAHLLFFAADRAAQLTRVPKLAAEIDPAGALWIVYPKGIRAIREIQVIEAGRAAGLKDVKVASFSPTHTALKFVLPISSR